MRRLNRKSVMLILPLGLVVMAMGCSSATPTDTPGVDQLGQYILKQEGPEVDVVLGYKFARGTVGDDWLILEMAISSPAVIFAMASAVPGSSRSTAGRRVSCALSTTVSVSSDRLSTSWAISAWLSKNS